MKSIMFVFLLTAVFIVGAQAHPESGPDSISATEDLMREHGVLSRVLLIYEEISGRIDRHAAFPPETLAEATEIIRNFIQGYHEKLEEKYLFVRFHKADKLIALVNTLKKQHDSGRKIIDDITVYEKSNNSKDKKKLARYLRLFAQMYRPHKAREDTVLFPAFHTIVTAGEYAELGEKFEAEEERLFGERGFEKTVARVAEIEKILGIHELSTALVLP